MNTIYLLGGPPRTAKSTIALSVIAQKPMPLISTDAVKAGWRNMLIDNPEQMLRSVEFKGWAEHKTSVTTGGERKEFAKNSNSEELTKENLKGIISHYENTNLDLLIEGDTITPEWAASLAQEGMHIRAAFVGYTDRKHIDTILAEAKLNKNDWVNGWLDAEAGNDTNIRIALSEQAYACQQLKFDAEGRGFSFFDISLLDFEMYTNTVRDYLLN